MSIASAPTAPSTSTPPAAAPPRIWNPAAALLSYLVPGLGQISQGRVGKGVLFFVCIYALFFYGTVLGSGTTKVSTPDPNDPAKKITTEYRIPSSVYLPDTAKDNNPLDLSSTLLANLYNRPQFLAQFWVGIAAWPAIWQYNATSEEDVKNPPLGGYQRAPNSAANNAVNTNAGRMLDLGWVLTVIAGVLNILVIYDALAGPAFLTPPPTPEPKAT